MKFRRTMSFCVMACIAVGMSTMAFAQPAPPPPRGGYVAPPPPQRPGAPLPPPAPGDHRDHRDDGRREDEARDRELRHEKELRDARRQARKDQKAWQESRDRRAEDRRKELQSSWGNNVVNRADARAELTLHADRMARLNRLMDIAEDRNDTAMQGRVQDLINREVARDNHVMSTIQAGG